MQVHELGFGLLPKSYVFKGTKEVTKEQILEQMCFFAGKKMPTTGVIAGTRDGLSSESIARFLLPASECEFVLNSVKNQLKDVIIQLNISSMFLQITNMILVYCRL
jgi:protein transport protein SEC23